MGISVAWDDKSRYVIRCVLDGSWTIQDFYRAADQVAYMILACESCHYVVIDIIGAPTPPQDFLAALHQTKTIFPFNLANIIMVSNEPFARGLCDTMLRMFPQFDGRLYLTATLFEARAFIAHQESR